MDRVQETNPSEGLLPLNTGAFKVAAADVGYISSVMPYLGGDQAALEAALGMGFPAPLRSTTAGDARCVWAGQGEALLMGVAPDPALAEYAAVVDQSDAWAMVTLHGVGGAEVLARLVPVDMRVSAFGVGATVRAQLGHMNASITRISDDTILIGVFRSMVTTLVHDLTRALEAVAARG